MKYSNGRGQIFFYHIKQEWLIGLWAGRLEAQMSPLPFWWISESYEGMHDLPFPGQEGIHASLLSVYALLFPATKEMRQPQTPALLLLLRRNNYISWFERWGQDYEVLGHASRYKASMTLNRCHTTLTLVTPGHCGDIAVDFSWKSYWPFGVGHVLWLNWLHFPYCITTSYLHSTKIVSTKKESLNLQDGHLILMLV